MHLPHPNKFIPNNFDVDVKKVDKPATKPTLLKDTSLSRLWHKKDDVWWIPKAHVYLNLKSPNILKSAKSSVCTRILIELLLEEMNEYAYDAECAGLAYSAESMGDGVLIHVKGYNDKLNILLIQVIKCLKNLVINQNKFDVVKERIQRVYSNFSMDAPLMHANVSTYALTQDVFYTFDQRLNAIKDIKKEDIDQYNKELLSQMHLEMFVHGNLTNENANETLEKIEDILRPESLTNEQKLSLQSSLVPKGDYIYKTKVENPSQLNSAIEYYNEVGDITDLELRTKLSLFAQIVNEPAFDQLRTKEQLGYMVFSGIRKSVGSMGFRILIQSERPPKFLEDRIEEFYTNTIKNLLDNLTDEQFNKNVTSLINEKLEKPKNLNNESSRFWLDISSGYYDFHRRLKEVEVLKKLTKDDILSFFVHYIHVSIIINLLSLFQINENTFFSHQVIIVINCQLI